jgi:molybdopterin-binding protein
MSNLVATISHIQSNQNLNIVKFVIGSMTLSMMSLELSDNIKIDTKVRLSIKPTNVGIGKNLSGDISYSNQLQAIIESIEYGELLASILMRLYDGSTLESIITKESAIRLNLKHDDKVIAIIKASDISILEVIDD